MKTDEEIAAAWPAFGKLLKRKHEIEQFLPDADAMLELAVHESGSADSAVATNIRERIAAKKLKQKQLEVLESKFRRSRRYRTHTKTLFEFDHGPQLTWQEFVNEMTLHGFEPPEYIQANDEYEIKATRKVDFGDVIYFDDIIRGLLFGGQQVGKGNYWDDEGMPEYDLPASERAFLYGSSGPVGTLVRVVDDLHPAWERDIARVKANAETGEDKRLYFASFSDLGQ